MIFNFALFLLWASSAAMFLIIGPYLMPERVPDAMKDKPVLGLFCGVMAMWNLVRFWNARSLHRERQAQAAIEEDYIRRTNPTESADNTKPIVHPEFKFDDETPPNS